MFQKIAADLGEKNIPRALLETVSPKPLKALWWREESSNPEYTTVEMWTSEDDTFMVFSGFSGGEVIEWTTDNINLFGEYDDKGRALSEIKGNFTFMQDEEPHEQTVAKNRLKRLIRKN